MLYSLTTKYAVIALVELACRSSDRPVLVKVDSWIAHCTACGTRCAIRSSPSSNRQR
jgi:hypothetical protein